MHASAARLDSFGFDPFMTTAEVACTTMPREMNDVNRNLAFLLCISGLAGSALACGDDTAAGGSGGGTGGTPAAGAGGSGAGQTGGNGADTNTGGSGGQPTGGNSEGGAGARASGGGNSDGGGGDGGNGGEAGNTGEGGEGGGGLPCDPDCVCIPSTTSDCYTGPPETMNVGECAGGSHLCDADGLGFGACENQILPTVDDCNTPGDEDCDGAPDLCPGGLRWSKRFGDATVQDTNGVAVDAAGNVIIVGTFAGSVNFGGGALTSAGGTDIFVAKLNRSGGHLWSKRFGNDQAQRGLAVATDATGNVLLTGDFAGQVNFDGSELTAAGGTDVFLAKLDASGNHVWSKRFGDSAAQSGLSLSTDSAGDVLLTGVVNGQVDFGLGALVSAGAADLFVAKLDGVGNPLWGKIFGNSAAQSNIRGRFDATGNVLLAGDFGGAVDFGGGQLTTAGGTDLFVSKLDAGGAHLWSKRFGDAGAQTAGDLACDGDGNVLFTGGFSGYLDFGTGQLTSAGGSDIFISKLDAAGTAQWAKRMGDTFAQSGLAVVADPSGKIVATGRFAGTTDFGLGPLTSAGGNDLYVVGLNADGTPRFSLQYGDASSQEGRGIATEGTDNLVVAGSFAGSIAFDSQAPLISAGNNDVFVALLAR